MLRVHLKSQPPSNYRQAFNSAEEAKALKILLEHLNQNSIMMINTCSAMLSTAMTEQEISILAQQLEQGFKLVIEQVPALANTPAFT